MSIREILSGLIGANTVQQAKALAADAPAAAAHFAKIEAAFSTAGIDMSCVLEDEGYLARCIQARVDGAEAAQVQLTADLEAARKTVASYEVMSAKLGIQPSDSAEHIEGVLEAHVSKRAAEQLAAQGVPAPIADGPSAEAEAEDNSDTAIYAKYKGMKNDAERIAYYAANSAAIWRASRAAGAL